MNIFFDLDGTLIDSKERMYHLFCFLIPDNNLTYEEYWALKKNKIDHKKIILQNLNYPELFYDEFNQKWMNLIEDEYWLKLDKPFFNVFNILKKLSNNYDLYLVTARQSKEIVVKQLNNLGMKEYFKNILVTHQKEEKFDLILKNVNVTSYDFIIGDTGKDIEAGKRINIRTIAVTTGFQSKDTLITYNPDYIIDNINQLENIL
jgi:phosphoglycolate phosphatase